VINYLEKTDKELFLFLNSLNHPYMDEIMLLVSNKFFWIPLYFLLLLLIIKKYGLKPLLIILPVAALIIAASDIVSTQLFKELIKRYRPCHNEDIRHLVHLPGNCGGLHGFISSHASNSFAIALITGLLLRGKVLYLMLLWALLVSYSRIYLGVHYPADILGGAILGSLLAWGGTDFMLKKLPPTSVGHQ
jgi:undecaprenyl-diphosphatase